MIFIFKQVQRSWSKFQIKTLDNTTIVILNFWYSLFLAGILIDSRVPYYHRKMNPSSLKFLPRKFWRKILNLLGFFYPSNLVPEKPKIPLLIPISFRLWLFTSLVRLPRRRCRNFSFTVFSIRDFQKILQKITKISQFLHEIFFSFRLSFLDKCRNELKNIFSEKKCILQFISSMLTQLHWFNDSNCWSNLNFNCVIWTIIYCSRCCLCYSFHWV